jgi:ATP-dependent Clp protease ATP-binding subunit ClpA
MQRELVNQLAKAILDGTVHRDSAITVDAEEGRIVLKNT